jgi:hypothetical protein
MLCPSQSLARNVYCGQDKPGLVAKTTISIDAFKGDTAVATRPRGSEAFSGGWRHREERGRRFEAVTITR